MKINSIKSDLEIEIIDRSSVYILTRSVIEAFLTLEYLYFNEEPKDVKEFRFKLWNASGLMSRQNTELVGPPPENVSEVFKKLHMEQIEQLEELKKQRMQEQEILEQLLVEIKASPHYQQLSVHVKET